MAFSYSDDYLDSVGTSPETDIFVRGPIDAKVSYRVNRNFKVFAEFLNLTEEPLREYRGIRTRENDSEIYEWKARFGVNFSL